MKIAFVMVPIVILAMAAGWMHATAKPPVEVARVPAMVVPPPEKHSNDAEILRVAKDAVTAPPKAVAPPKPPPPADPGAFVKLKGASLSDACTAVGAQSGITITLDSAIAAISIDLDIENCTAQEFIDYVCEIAGAEAVESNGGIFIRPKKE